MRKEYRSIHNVSDDFNCKGKEGNTWCTSGLSCSLNTESIIQWIVIYPVESAIHRLNNQGQESLQKSGLYPHDKIQDFVNVDGHSSSSFCLIVRDYFHRF